MCGGWLELGGPCGRRPELELRPLHPVQLGRRNLCQNMVELGVTRNGGFAELVTAPQQFVYKVSPRLTWKEGAMVEPLSCVVHGFWRSRVRPDETAVVFGAGPMGLFWVALLKARVSGG